MSLKDRLYYRAIIANLFFCSLGCLSCFYLQKYYLISSVLASVIVGLVASFLPKSSFYDSKISIACIYTGSFAGMCSLSFFNHKFDILILSLLVGVYFNLLSPYFKGMGGKLGSIGFFSSLSFVLIKGFIW